MKDPSANPIVRLVALIFGLAALVLGVAGFLIPGLPGVPFLLVAAWAFSYSSPRLFHWMMTNRWFGQILSDYRAGLGIPRRIKVVAISTVTIVVSTSVTFALEGPVRFLVLGLGLVGVAFILTRPTRETIEAAPA